MEEKYLPLGSVVLLKGAKHRISIIGFCFTIKEKNNRQYDYVGVPYPEGFLGISHIMYFDHSDIESIINVAFSDDEEKDFKKRLKETVKRITKDGDSKYIDESKIKDFIKNGDIKYEQY